MLRSFLFAIVALAAACSAPSSVDEAKAPDQTPFIGIDGKPLITPDGNLDNSVLMALTENPRPA